MKQSFTSLITKLKSIKPFYLAVFVALTVTVVAAIAIFGVTVQRREEINARQSQKSRENGVTRLVSINGKEVKAELASTPRERMLGLSYRESLDNGSGMLFTFGIPGEYSFWMKNMKISIDILWISEGMEVVDIDENLDPCTQDICESLVPAVPVKYVLEVPTGWSANNNVRIGDKVEFPELLTGATQP